MGIRNNDQIADINGKLEYLEPSKMSYLKCIYFPLQGLAFNKESQRSTWINVNSEGHIYQKITQRSKPTCCAA